MKAQLTERLRRVETTLGARVGGVVTMLAGETPEQAAARAVAGGRKGPFLVVPAAVSVEAWSAGIAGLASYQAECERQWREARARRLQQSQG